jgi:hypothetical protein
MKRSNNKDIDNVPGTWLDAHLVAVLWTLFGWQALLRLAHRVLASTPWWITIRTR